MSDISHYENEFNVKEFLKKEILQYYNITFSNKDRNPKAVTLKIDYNTYREFLNTLMDNHFRLYGNIGLTVEALMRLYIDCFRVPKIIQTTLFYKPEIHVQQNINLNIAQKLELKLVRNELQYILIALEQEKALDFWLPKLRDTIPKAIKTYEKTRDPKLEELLKQSEKWIEKIYRR